VPPHARPCAKLRRRRLSTFLAGILVDFYSRRFTLHREDKSMPIARVLTLAAVGATMFATAASADMKFATGRQGGSQYPVSVALSQIMEKVPGIGSVTLTPGGGASNIVAVDKGLAELGITLSVSARAGMEGKPPYKEKATNLVQLFALHGFKMVVLVPADSPIKSFKDLAGKKVNTGPKGFTITEVAKQIFAMEHMTVDMQYLRVTAAVQQFKDGHLDALFYSPSDRYAPFIDLAQARKIRLVPFPQELMDRLQKADPTFYRTEFPVADDIYKGLVNKVQTLGYPNIIIANKNKVSDKQAYEMTKAVAEHMDRVAAVEPSLKTFKLNEMALSVGVPISAGSMKFFKEKGWVK
jgi:TRAP transporter TAXI family solute receptor